MAKENASGARLPGVRATTAGGRCHGCWFSRAATLDVYGLLQDSLEIEAVDVALVEQHRGAENDLAAADLDGAQPAGLERARPGLEFPLRQQRAGVDRQVSEVARVPQDDCLY